MGVFSNVFEPGMVHQVTLLNQVNLEDFPDGTVLLATEEGYVMAEEDNIFNLLAEE